MTPAEKAKRTKIINKLMAEEEARIAPVRDSYYAFAETFYPERNAKLDALDQLLEDTKKQIAIQKEAIMEEFREATKTQREAYEAAISNSYALFKQSVKDAGYEL